MEKGSMILDTVLSYLPNEVADSISRYLSSSGGRLNEVRLRSEGTSVLVVSGRNVMLPLTLSFLDMREIFKKICDGAVFAHRDDVARGFVSLPMGVRVGVCGHARYDGGRVVGVGEITSLVFRLPGGECSFAKELYNVWRRSSEGMLICSRAGEGKTTAIRSLARLIGMGEDMKRVVVADERCEFDASDYTNASVDILSGYRRALGVDIAIRTMSAEVLIVDEISSAEDARAMLASLGAGTTVIATVHASCLDDALLRPYVRELVEGGLFGSVCTVRRDGDKFSFRMDRIERERCKS